ncbi:MAG: tRNA (adenosine(37)-N6)-threonylcarbamoyltransferase complex ATPase subunit type 1 TsaE, partial [Desulfobulbus propionicus]
MFTIASPPLDHQSFNRVVQQLASILQAGDTLFLQGGLGAGKTTFVQQAAIALGIGEDQYVSSPSYG